MHLSDKTSRSAHGKSPKAPGTCVLLAAVNQKAKATVRLLTPTLVLFSPLNKDTPELEEEPQETPRF